MATLPRKDKISRKRKSSGLAAFPANARRRDSIGWKPMPRFLYFAETRRSIAPSETTTASTSESATTESAGETATASAGTASSSAATTSATTPTTTTTDGSKTAPVTTTTTGFSSTGPVVTEAAPTGGGGQAPPDEYGPFYEPEPPSDTRAPSDPPRTKPPFLSLKGGAFCFIEDAACRSALIVSADDASMEIVSKLISQLDEQPAVGRVRAPGPTVKHALARRVDMPRDRAASSPVASSS